METSTPARDVAGRMADAARAWLDRLDDGQRGAAVGAVPADDASDAERRRWFYTPTDHGGLTLHEQRPAQQRAALRLVATGLSTPGYVTVVTTIGLENVLDHAEGSSRGSTASAAGTRACTTCGSSASRARRGPGAGGSAGTTCRSTTSSWTASWSRRRRASWAPTRRRPRCSAAR